MAARVPAEASAAFKRQGIAYFERCEWTEALSAFDAALLEQAADPELHNYRARVLDSLERSAEALQAIDRALALQPENLADRRNRGLLLRKLGRPQEALACFEAVLAAKPRDLDLLLKRTHLLNELDRREEALASAESTLSFYPRELGALNARGMVLENLGRYAEALAMFDSMLKLEPACLDGINNQGLVQARLGNWRKALASYERSLALNPEQPQARYNRSLVKLALGDWRAGLREFECRWNAPPLKGAKPKVPSPLWLGQEPIEGRTLFVYHEQGYGDTLQCARYIPRLSERGARVILAVPPALVRLMRTLPGQPIVIPLSDAVPVHDWHCPLMSLPLAFGTTPETIPTQTAYLQVDPAEALRARLQLGSARGLRIGLAWSGRRYAPINYPRDLSLAQLDPLLRLNAQFVSLQKEISSADHALLPLYPQLDTRSAQVLEDFAATAALISQLDLVISVDTAVAHLAGALGKPVWLLNRHASCWRWGQQGTATPWYPSMRVFRQDAVGEWGGVVERVRGTAAELIAQIEPRAAHAAGSVAAGSAVKRRAPETIRVVTASRVSQQEFFGKTALGRSLRLYRGYPKHQRVELRLFANNRQGLASVYNQAIEESKASAAVLLFIHDDVHLTDFHWMERLLKGLDEFEIVGLAGNRRRVPRQPSWMYLDEALTSVDRENLSGVVGHGQGFPHLRQLSVYGEPGQDAKLLDGVVLAARSRTMIEKSLRFDPRFAFHFYDMDFCRQAELRGVRMGTWSMSVIHESGGRLGSAEWRSAYRTYLEKYGE